MRIAEQGIRMTEHGNELCGEEGMRKTKQGIGMIEQGMVTEQGMTDYSSSLNK
jgi:hypothetical protein